MVFKRLKDIFFSPSYTGSTEIIGITDGVLELILTVCESNSPNEYIALLRTTPTPQLDEDLPEGLLITDILYAPGMRSTPTSATYNSHTIPLDKSIVGSVHSHPNGVLQPSSQDLNVFRRGKIHIIVAPPFTKQSWKAFDSDGNETNLNVVTIEDSP